MRSATRILSALLAGGLLCAGALAQTPTVLTLRGSLFQSPPIGIYHKDVEIGDIDNDGWSDLYLPTLQSFGEGPTIDYGFLGTGEELDELPSAFILVPTATMFPVSFMTDRGYDGELVDLDGDGNLDIIRPDRFHWIHVAWGDGSGTFPQVTTLVDPLNDQNLSGNYDDAAYGDLDNDGDLDFVIAEYATTGSIVTCVNQLAQGSPRSFNVLYSAQTNLVTNRTHSVFIGDFDQDNLGDVLLANHNGASPPHSQLYHGQTPTPSFAPPSNLLGDPSDPDQDTIAVNAEFVDLDRDGLLDVFVGRRSTSYIFFHSGNHSDPYPTATSVANFTGDPYDVRFGDLDLDGLMEIVMINCCSSAATQMRAFTVAADRSVTDRTAEIIDQVAGSLALDLGDLDQDGDLDLITGGDTTGVPAPGAATYVYENKTHLILRSKTILGTTEDFFAFKTVTAQDAVTQGSGSVVTLRAGEKLVLKPGFRADEGADVRVMIDPSL